MHKTRDLLVRQRTMLINALRGHLGEFGVIAPQGPSGMQAALKALREDDEDLPELARAALGGLAEQLELLGAEIGRLERRILDWHRQDETSRRLATIPGIRPITASAMAPVRRIRSSSVPADSSQPGWGSHPEQTAAAGRSARAASAKWATAIFDASWSPAQPPSFGWRASVAERAGSAIYSNGKSRGSPPWPWPTRPLASPGHSWLDRRIIGP